MPVCLLCRPPGKQPSFPDIQTLQQHINSSHVLQASNPAICVLCARTFKDATAKQQHMQSKNHYVCTTPSCARKFATSDELQRHAAAHATYVECSTCHLKLYPEALQEHIRVAHAPKFTCKDCQKTFTTASGLSQHSADRHPSFPCPQCSEILRSVDERNRHKEQKHPICSCGSCNLTFSSRGDLDKHTARQHLPFPCTSCKDSFVSSSELDQHVSSAHFLASCEFCPQVFNLQSGLESHAAAKHPTASKCGICQHPCASKSTLDEHVAAAHSCPSCPNSVFLTLDSLEEHLAEHRLPYRCQVCGTRYPEDKALSQHFRDSADDVHPTCTRCDVAFVDATAYISHVDATHPQLPCGSCDGRVFDPEELPGHYLSSKNHPVCETCHSGFSDHATFVAHGAYEHPEAHCFLCHWQFDSSDGLQRHIKHFGAHPRCEECDVRFADAESYHSHLFDIHQPGSPNHTRSFSTRLEISPRDDDITLRSQASPSSLPAEKRSTDDWSPNTEDSLPYAAFIPLPPSTNGSSSPLTHRSVSPSRTPSNQDIFAPWSTVSRFADSSTIDAPWTPTKASGVEPSPPLSSMPLVGTPAPTQSQTLPDFDSRSPFSPRQEGSPFFEAPARPISILAFNDRDMDSDSMSSVSAKSPQLVSPVVGLPEPGEVSPTSSEWSTVSGSGSKVSLPLQMPSRKSSQTSGSGSPRIPVVLGGRNVPRLEVPVPQAEGRLSSGFPLPSPFSASPSSISPESAVNNLSVSLTPEYLREARAYLALTNVSPQPQYVVSPTHSPALSSPVLSSTGYAAPGRGKKREVRFEENILTEQLWGQQSSSSDESSMSLPSPRVAGMQGKQGVSRLPRLTSFKRGRMPNGRSRTLSSSTGHSASSATSALSMYHCRVCHKDPCDDLTATMCGHLFCNSCITEAVLADSRCPVCKAATLLYCLFRIDTNS